MRARETDAGRFIDVFSFDRQLSSTRDHFIFARRLQLKRKSPAERGELKYAVLPFLCCFSLIRLIIPMRSAVYRDIRSNLLSDGRVSAEDEGMMENTDKG